MPGISNSAPGTSPAKIAIAAIEMIAATAGIGSMKKVIGTRRAMPITAVRPGMAPITMPSALAPKMTRRT